MQTTLPTTNSPKPREELFFRTFLFKVAARCNIACTYCYEYRLADHSWRQKPVRMSDAVFDAAVGRVVEHVESHRIPSINVIFHGGEPLLAGQRFFRRAVCEMRKRLEPHCAVSFGIQSNGTLIDESWLDLLKELNLTVGISLDGPSELNDVSRVDYRGRSTFAAVRRSLELMQREQYRGVCSGMLCVIQPQSDPVGVIEWFSDWGESRLDLLLPHYNHHTTPPYSWNPEHGYGYGRWLARAFDHWWQNDLSALRIRIFEDIMHLLLGGYFTVESLGLSPARIVVIQTDGSYEALDSLKSSYDGAVCLETDIFSEPMDHILNREIILSRILRADSLCETCASCQYRHVCGGGYVPHRYHPQFGFSMPSVYCKDLMYLIRHIETRLRKTAQPDILNRLSSAFAVNKGSDLTATN